MPLETPWASRVPLSSSAILLLNWFVDNDAYFLHKLWYLAQDRALFKLYMAWRVDLTKLWDDSEVMRSMLESLFEVIAAMLGDEEKKHQLIALLTSDPSFAQIAVDYYALTPISRYRTAFYEERKKYISFPENIRTQEWDTVEAMTRQTAHTETRTLNLDISGREDIGEIVFGGKNVSEFISRKTALVAPISQRLSSIKSACGTPIRQTLTLSHTVRLFKEGSGKMYLCITDEFLEGMILEFTVQGEVAFVYRTEDFVYPIIKTTDSHGNTNVLTGETIHVSWDFRMWDNRGGWTGESGWRARQPRENAGQGAGNRDRRWSDKNTVFSRRNVVEGSNISWWWLSKIGDTGPGDVDNIQKLQLVYDTWKWDVTTASLVSIMDAYFTWSTPQQDTSFGDNCIAIDLVRGWGAIRTYVLYRGSFNNVSAIQQKYTKNGIQPLIMWKLG